MSNNDLNHEKPVFFDTVVALLNVNISNTNESLIRLDKKLDKFESDINSKFEKIDSRLDKMESEFNNKFEKMEQKIDKINDKFDIKFDTLHALISSRFIWLLSFTLGGFGSTYALIAHVAHWI